MIPTWLIPAAALAVSVMGALQVWTIFVISDLKTDMRELRALHGPGGHQHSGGDS